MSWNVSHLQQNYAREVIGFDLRDISIDFSSFNQHKDILSVDLKNELPATVDNQIWAEYDDKYEIDAQCNGFNFFDQVDNKIQEVAAQGRTLLVAFDVSAEFADLFKVTFALVPLSMKLLSEKRGWRFLGFDVVDIRTQCSAFYSFDWSQKEWQNIVQKTALKINSCGIISSESEALNLSLYFDKIIPEHAPFSPCGVWVYQK